MRAARIRSSQKSPQKQGVDLIPAQEPPPNPILKKCGAIRIVPYGPNLSFARTKLLEMRIIKMGGQVAESPKNAKIIVVDPELRSRELLKEHVTSQRFASIPKLTLDWLEAVLKGEEKDPCDDIVKNAYCWSDPNTSTGMERTMMENLPAEKAMLDSHDATEDEQNRRPSLDTEATSDAGAQASKDLGMNQVLIDELSKMADMCAARGDKWRAKSYAQAATIIKTLDFPVHSSRDLLNRKGIGKAMAAHIDEILTTGRYQKRVDLEKDPRTNASVELMKIFGVGKAQASRLYNLGFHSPEEVRTALHMNDERLTFLNRNQRIGVELYEELNQRIRRDEIERIVESIKENLAIAYPKQLADKITVEATGSYRRGKKDCGDCDILLTCPSYPQHRVCLRPLLQVLMKPATGQTNGMVITHSLVREDDWLSQSTEDAPHEITRRKNKREILDANQGVLVTSLDEEKQVEPESFMGICHLYEDGKPIGVYHRIDIKSYPFECYPFALLYFTGSALFSRNMRHIAHGKGYTLTDRGLYPYIPSMESLAAKSRLNCIQCQSERDIFDVLQLEYKEPKDRNYDEVIDLVNDDDSASVVTAKSSSVYGPKTTVKQEPSDYNYDLLYGKSAWSDEEHDSPQTKKLRSERSE